MTNDAAPAPAVKSAETGSDGLNADQAAALLFAKAKPSPTPAAKESAATTTETEQSAASTETAAAEAPDASADTATTESPETPEPSTDDATPESTESAADDVLSPATLDEKLKAQIQKRIDKEVMKRKTLETRLAEMEAKLNSAAAPAATPDASAETPASAANGNVPLATPNNPLAKINDLTSLKQRKQIAKDAVRWAEDTLENPRAWKTKVDVDGDTGEEIKTRFTQIGKDVYDEAQIRAIRRDAKIELEDSIPQREEFLTMRDRATKTAHASFPFLTDKANPDYAKAQSLLRDPWIQMRPDAEYFVGLTIMGMKGLEGQKSAAEKPAAPKPKAPVAKPSSDQAAISASGSPSRIAPDSGQRMARSAEHEKLAAKGGISTAEAVAFLTRNSPSRKSG